MDCCLPTEVPGCAVSLSFSDLVLGCVSYNPCIARSLFVWLLYFSACLYADCVCDGSASALPQVIYKKFNVPCPFVDFALNATAGGLNVSATDPGGEDDPACIPKMANLNTQVGLRMSLSVKLQIHPCCHGHRNPLTVLYVIVIFSMLPVTAHDPSMEKALRALKVMFTQLLTIGESLRLIQDSKMDSDP